MAIVFWVFDDFDLIKAKGEKKLYIFSFQCVFIKWGGEIISGVFRVVEDRDWLR
ncbi:hypothetical protein COLO4_37067 [Corchorus olitorius]|uniref:Uncharacterized protein n=1 Tax=Corchorus olitorius TaxID=93759 RepID=A0A1R3G3I1_9ROSI|nr:hypothetical protein COLO4_37067 [Corchorus olitorius]